MSRFSKLVLVAAVTVAGLASPAFAQSFDPEVGTGNVLSFSYTPSATQNQKMAAPHTAHAVAMRRNGLHAFAMASAPFAAANPFDPALTGRGSRGYNDNLRNDY